MSTNWSQVEETKFTQDDRDDLHDRANNFCLQKLRMPTGRIGIFTGMGCNHYFGNYAIPNPCIFHRFPLVSLVLSQCICASPVSSVG